MAMKSCLRRTQSLKGVAATRDHTPIWAEGRRGGARDASVSQLVARYQSTVEVGTAIKVTRVDYSQTKLKHGHQETKTTKSAAASSQVSPQHESQAESPPKRAGEGERSPPRTMSNLTRSRSMGSLRHCSSSVRALKDLFEAKRDARPEIQRTTREENRAPPPGAKMADGTVPEMNGCVGQREAPRREAPRREAPQREAPRRKADADGHADVDDANGYADTEEQEVVKQKGTDRGRGKSIGGIDFEKIAASHYGKT